MNHVKTISFRHRLHHLAFWRDWPSGRRRGALYPLLALTAAGSMAAWLSLYAATQRSILREEAAMELHQHVSALVAEIRSLDRGPNPERANLPILVAARQLSRDIGLEDKLISVRPALQATGRDGVQLYYERLTLPDLLALLETLSRDGGLHTSTVTFNRRLDNPSLADLQLVLYR